MRFGNFFLSYLALALLLLGCSTPSSPTAPAEFNGESNNGLFLGKYQIIYDPVLETLKIEPVIPERGAQYDVTKWAKIGIDKLEWDPVTRNWTIYAWLKNPTSLTGFGVWIVFVELGEKKLIGQDGFIWYPKGDTLARVPFLAVGKDQPLRSFPPLHQENVTVVIHWPEGVNIWAPIQFIIDAEWPSERQTPMVENLSSGNDGQPVPTYYIKGWVADFQDESSELDVYADLTPIGGDAHTPLYDDGMHNDNGAGDSIFGLTFNSNATPGNYVITIHAVDPAGHPMENDVALTIIKPTPYTIHLLSPNGGEVWDVGSDHEITWESTYPGGTVYLEYSKDDFVSDIHTIAIDEPNDGSMMWVNIPNDPSQTVKVRVTVTGQPSISDVSDNYFIIYTEEDPCQDWMVIREGLHCSVDWEWEVLCRNEEEWQLLLQYVPWPNPPTIDWNTEMVAGFFLGEMLHGGYEIEVNFICLDDFGTLYIDYTKWWPGEGCWYPWVICYPYQIIKTKKYDGAVAFHGEWKEKICK